MTGLRYIDTHAHLALCEDPIDQLCERAKQAGVDHIVNVAINLEGAKQAKKTHRDYPMVLPTIGIHPCEVKRSVDFSDMIEMLQVGGYVAIGEVGLDYYWSTSHIQEQKAALSTQIEFALQYDLPVIIHNRDADDDMVDIIRRYPGIKVVFHCFSGGPELVDRLSESADAYFSFTGSITFSKKGKTLRAIKSLPLDRIMIETDCPYLTPASYKGTKNEPSFVPEIAKKIAEVKEVDIAKVAMQTTETAKAFFSINT